ncbi:hypothetical protein FP828_07985 [bacterium]|nr:hypothetical protein [bacterium]
MRETKIHSQLVAFTKQWIEKEYVSKRVEIIGVDSVTENFQVLPNINGFIPDIFAKCLVNNLQIIGEAESSKGLNSQHTEQQLKAFIRYCFLNNAHLIVGVPWDLVPYARKLIKFYISECKAEGVIVIIPDNMAVG